MRVRTGGIERSGKQNSTSINTFDHFNNNNYNTSIIDLKIFKGTAESSTSNVLRSASVGSDCSDSITSANSVYYNRHEPFHYQSNNMFINKQIQTNKKYLINKNIRFYDPIKDAKVLSQLDSVRAKLYSGKVSKVNKEPIRLEVNELPNGLLDEQPSHTRNKHEIKESTAELIKQEEELKKLIDSYKRSKTIDIAQIVKEPVKSEPPLTQKNNNLNSNNIYDENSFDVLKKYRQKRVMSSLPSASDTFLSYKVNSKKQVKQEDTDQDKNSNKLNQTNLINKYPNVGLASPPRIERGNTFVNSIRKSRKYRYDNIYKPIDVLESRLTSAYFQHQQQQQQKLDKPQEKHTNLAIKELKKNSVKNTDLNLTLTKSKSFVEDLNTELVCNDPKCEFNYHKNQQLIDYIVSNQTIKREYPNERFQRLKENGEYSKQKKLTSDIPNTLSTLSQVGRMSNFEKLLSTSLNHYFSQYRRLIK